MRIVFLSGGARALALRCLLESKENVVGVVTPQLSRTNSRFSEVILCAAGFGVPVFPVEKGRVVAALRNLQFELLISCGFPYILGPEVIGMARFAINVHPTLLPKYRGFRSGPYMIMNNERKAGVTVHRLTPEMDRGDILAQKEFPLTSFDTTKSVYRKTREVEPRVLLEVVQRLKSGDESSMAQNEAEASEYRHIRTPRDSEIDPRKSLLGLYNEIRACDPEEYPAFFFVEGEKVCLKLWRPTKRADEADMI
jgi:methionyl-tRNA formyltransferase